MEGSLAMLRGAAAEYETHFNRERNHQGIGNRLVEPDRRIRKTFGPVRRRERLGGLLNYYHRRAA